MNAASVYGVDAVIMGGDITGKYFVLIVEEVDGWRAYDGGNWRPIKDADEVREFQKKISAGGGYPLLVTPDEERLLATDAGYRKEFFKKAVLNRVSDWVKLAEERLGPKAITCFMSPGNDDDPGVSEVLNSSSWVRNPDGRITEVDGHEMVSWGWSNTTPWDTPREQSEEELEASIEALAARLSEPSNAIFNLHCPPLASGLDSAPALDAELRPVAKGGDVEMTPVGSSAVRSVIERYQPLLGLHGHIHESRGVKRIGRSVCVNPGSDYQSGVLRGALLHVQQGKVRRWTLTTG